MNDQNLNWFEKLNESLSRSMTVKLMSITFITLVLLIPETMITSLIRERENTMNDAVKDVSGKWSGSQQVAGPVLVIPYNYSETDVNGKIRQVKKSAYFLPDRLDIKSTVTPEKRYRGLYSVIVYKSNIHLSGKFPLPDFTALGIGKKDVLWRQAHLQIGIDDLRGISDTIALNWGNANYEFNPGNTDKSLFPSGVSAMLPLDSGSNFMPGFDINISLKGSENLYFVPVGKETTASMSSSWNSPSFTGDFLPANYELTNDGFNAAWKILDYNRNYPQQWTDETQSLSGSAFGVNFLLPADQYLKSLRSSKYAILVIALTFLVFFLVEIMAHKRIHPIQYVLVGLSLTLFYILLLSISEYIGFNLAYLLAALLIILQISLYSRTLFEKSKTSLLMLVFLFVTYGFIYVLLQLEKYSLLVGSLGLFLALGITMYVTRKINWYRNYN